MKKIIYSLVVMTFAFFAASCQQENLEQFANGNTVTYTVQVPDVITTRATGTQRVDGLIYEVYREAEIADLTKSPIYEGTAVINESGTAELVMEFVRNQKFIVLFWAQNSNVDVYTTDDLRQVSLANLLTANDFTTEVFSGIDTVDDCVSSKKGEVELKRPIAQINIATSQDGLTVGDPAKGNTTTVELNESEVTVEGLFTTYNVYNQNVSGEGDFTYAKAEVPAGDFKTDYPYVAMTYVGFADEAGTNVDVKFNIYTSEGKIEHTVNNVPVKANYRTNILGNLITGTAGYAVSIDNNWITPDNNIEVVTVSNAADLQDAINNIQDGSTGNIQLEGDIILGALAGMMSTKSSTPSYGLLIPAGKTLILDLNGCTLNQEVGCTASYSMIENRGHLTIIDSKSEGKISFNDSGAGDPQFGWGSYTISNQGTLVVNSGTIEHTGKQNTQDNVAHMYCAIQQNNDKAILTVNGGTISNQTYRSIRINSGKADIKGGNMIGQVWVHPFADNINLNIEGGNFQPTGADGSSVFVTNNEKSVTFSVTGGFFATKISCSVPANLAGTVTGGTFTTSAKENTPADLYEGYVFVQDSENWNLVKALASVGDTKYPTLNAAFDATKEMNEATIVVLGNAELNSVTIKSGKNITLDLNEYTVAGSSSATGKNYNMLDVNGGTLTVKNGTINYQHLGENMGWGSSTNIFNVTAGGVLNLEGVTAKNLGGSDMGFVAHLNNWGEVTLNVENSTLESNYVAVRVFNSGYDMNNVTIKNSILKGGSYAFWVHNYTTADFGGDAEKAAQQQALLNLDIFDNGNTFIGKNDTPIRYGMTDAVYTAVPAAAKIGDKEYTSLQEAIDAVKDGETIVLMRDVKVIEPAYGQNAINHARPVNFTLDLNKKTLSADTGNSVFRFNISATNATENVTVTIKNGTVISGDNTWCTVMATGLSDAAKAVFNLVDLTINSSKPGDFAVKSWANAVINANNVTVNATECAGGFYAVGGEIVLDNCTVNQTGLWTSPYMSMAVAVSTSGKLTVNSGNYTTTPTAASEGYNQGTSHGSWAAGVMNSGGKLIINGGTFANGNYGDDALATAARGLIFGDTASEIIINDGVFNALKNIIDYQNNLGVQPNPNIVINGGDFSADPSIVTSYGGVVIKEGYTPLQGSNGRWTLVEGNFITSEAALKTAFEKGGDIVLGADIKIAEPLILAEGKTAVLDLNGKTITGANESDVKHIYALKNYGTLAVVDNSAKRDGSINSRGIYNYGSLKLDSGKISAIDGNGGYAVNNQSGSTFVMNGGWVAADNEDGDAPKSGNYDATAINIPSNAQAQLNGGKITNAGNFTFAVASAGTLTVPAESTITIEGRHGAFAISGGETTIASGTYSIPENTENTDNVVYVYSSGKLVINGGRFIADNDVPNGGACVYDENGGVIINGGVFGNSSGGDVWGSTGTVIKGGKFDNLTETSHIADGYELNADGEVVKK